MTSSSELFDSMFKPNVSSTTLKRALQYVHLFNSIFTWLTLYYDYSGARKKVKRVKRAFSSRQARRAQNLSSMRYVHVCVQVQLSAECLHIMWRQLQ